MIDGLNFLDLSYKDKAELVTKYIAKIHVDPRTFELKIDFGQIFLYVSKRKRSVKTQTAPNTIYAIVSIASSTSIDVG